MTNKNIDSNARVILFLGAGASASLNIPTSKSFLKFMKSEHKWNTELLSNICADYLQSMGKGKYTSEEIDAEDLRDWLVSMERTAESLAKAKSDSVPPLSRYPGDPQQAFIWVNNVRKEFEKIIRETYKGVSEKEAYKHYNTLLQRLFKFGLSVLPIFTTNYDLVLENYAEYPHDSLDFIDGFFRSPSGAGDLRLDTSRFKVSTSTKNTILFFKLHGSTNWFKHKERNEVIRLPFGTPPDPEHDYLLIYPTKGKEETLKDYPFNEYYTYLKGYLENESVRLCIVIGYSFGDTAINEHFKTAIKRGMRLLIIDPNPDAANLRSKISLQSNQHTICSSPFDSQYWIPHITRALEQELKRLSA